MAGLAVLSVTMILASSPDPRVDLMLVIVGCVQALLTIGLGTYLAAGRGGTAELVPVRGTWRRVFLLIAVLLGVLQSVWQLIDDPGHWVGAATWPNLVALVIFLQFGSSRHHFRSKEQWTTALPRQDAVETLVRVFDQQGLSAKTAGSDDWEEISREWQGDWRHRDAARHMKVRPWIHFVVDAADNGTRITAFSGDSVLGQYDVLKLADEMSEVGVALAKEATP